MVNGQHIYSPKELTKWGVGIISGLALGIDTYSHRGRWMAMAILLGF